MVQAVTSVLDKALMSRYALPTTAGWSSQAARWLITQRSLVQIRPPLSGHEGVTVHAVAPFLCLVSIQDRLTPGGSPAGRVPGLTTASLIRYIAAKKYCMTGNGTIQKDAS